MNQQPTSPKDETKAKLKIAMNALHEIASYDSPEDIDGDFYGLSDSDAIEMAYENVVGTAKWAINKIQSV